MTFGDCAFLVPERPEINHCMKVRMNRHFDLPLRFLASMSAVGTVLGLLFFAASLTPSLMPRPWLVQGVLSGTCAASGYMVGVFVGWLWRYLDLPWLKKYALLERAVTFASAVVIALVFLAHSLAWQNSIRQRWGMELPDSAEPVRIAVVAIATFCILFVVGRLFRIAAYSISNRLDKHVPRRVSNVIGVVLAAGIFWSVGEGVVVRLALDAADASFQKADGLIDADTSRPIRPAMTGSAASLVTWDGLGRQGRNFVSEGPEGEAIEKFWGKPTVDPIRVYVGLNNSPTVEQRASLALEELKRQGGFDRSVLLVVAPTGTGWVDPAAMDSIEYLHRGDVASVAVQYSYLASWLSLIIEPENGADTAQALFQKVYSYWKTLPSDERPKLYLYGLSLGALNSQMATDVYDVVADPFDGALWAGPPFRSQRWASVTRMRQPGSPAWLPMFRDGSIVRFANQSITGRDASSPWGPIRFVYLQYASDPVVFFEPSALYREPDWMKGQRGADVSPSFVWIPIVSGLQLAFDMAIATSSPIGYGHVYAPEHYIEAWVTLTEPEGVDQTVIDRLKRVLPSSRYE